MQFAVAAAVVATMQRSIQHMEVTGPEKDLKGDIDEEM
jgi:hypothetical protein